MDQEHVWCFGDQLTFYKLSFGVAFGAVEIVDDFSLDQALEALEDSLSSNDGQSKSMIYLNLVSGGTTTLADQLRTGVMSEYIIYKIPLTGGLKTLFKSIK